MPMMIHDKPWLLLVFAAIGFAMTWLMLPDRVDRREGDARGYAPRFEPERPETADRPERRRRPNRTEERIVRERLRRAGSASDPSPTPVPRPEWCIVLGVEPDIDRIGLRRAYVAAVKNVHPDCIGPDCPNVSETCAHLAEAYTQGRTHLGMRAVA